MTTELTKNNPRVDDLAQQIVDAFKESLRHKNDTIHSGRQAVLKAIETGALLCKAKRLVGHGRWEKWFADNIADQAGISDRTAREWMALSKRRDFADLRQADTLTKAYIMAGIIADTKPAAPKPIGMAEVDIIEQACSQAVKRLNSTFGFLSDAAPATWPAERKQELKDKLRPLVEVYEQL